MQRHIMTTHLNSILEEEMGRKAVRGREKEAIGKEVK